MKKLPFQWWLFVPAWLCLPIFLSIIALAARWGTLAAFLAFIPYMLLTLLAYLPIRRNQMTFGAALAWVGLGTAIVGVLGLAVILLLVGVGRR